MRTLKTLINDATRIVFVTGAGISTDCGIPDFRSSQGIYASWLTPVMFSTRLFKVWPWWFYHKAKPLYSAIGEAEPGRGHLAIAELGKRKKVTVVTQNVDRLHQKAGSRPVYEIHGTLETATCQRCGKTHPIEDCQTDSTVPRCGCGGVLKPDIVFFGDNLPQKAWSGACRAIAKADLIVVCGTSLTVCTAVEAIGHRSAGTPLVIVNRDETMMDREADLVIHGEIADVLETVV